jgi:hypothetical protein
MITVLLSVGGQHYFVDVDNTMWLGTYSQTATQSIVYPGKMVHGCHPVTKGKLYQGPYVAAGCHSSTKKCNTGHSYNLVIWFRKTDLFSQFLCLPTDVHNHILSMLSTADVIKIAQCSKYLYQLCSSDRVGL